MMKKKFALSLVCASMVALTGCSDDETTVYQDTPETLAKVESLEKQNGELDAKNDELTEQNTVLLAEIEELKENGNVKPYNFVTQCATVDINFDYVDPNAEESASVVTLAAEEQDCLSCHSYDADGGPAGVVVPHGDMGSCDTCHEGHSDGGGEPLPEDPTDPTYEQPTFAGGVDGKTGASGYSYYGSGSYLSADWLVAQINKKVHNYRWKEAADGETSVTELAAACGLDNREHMVDMFPSDGKAYVIEEKSNNNGASMVSTVNKFVDEGVNVETPNIAVFGYGLKKQGDDYYVTMSIGKNNSCYNMIMNGEARLQYYEYDPTQFEKTGLETPSRNRGARIIATTDYVGTALKQADWVTPVPGLDAGQDFNPVDVDWSQVGSCSLSLKVESIIPLG
ncbi:hypothetical protein [Ferrimonas aestuarii]|uniref:Uncharacterized protein n=1 Tax=Ferrimonas aestuarii TaxID=2569539 RepID=A0A4V6WMS2_9GAMM|nr:hypothetical protein [Ferrimonas aestuarii]TKB54313.1 hypothetical protein FCL42_13055 [Ferrimonas aestuarii]